MVSDFNFFDIELTFSFFKLEIKTRLHSTNASTFPPEIAIAFLGFSSTCLISNSLANLQIIFSFSFIYEYLSVFRSTTYSSVFSPEK